MTAAQLRRWRERMGWTQQQLADALGVDKQTVWRWEAGQRQPPAFLRLALERLAEQPP